MQRVRMNRRRLLRTGPATTVALGAAALPGPGWATTAGSHLGEYREEGRREDDSDDRDRGRGRTRASGQVIRNWNEVARSQPFINGTRLSRVLSIMHGAQHDAVNAVDARYRTYASTLSDRNAAAEVLRRFTGADDFAFCMESTTATLARTQRCWASFRQAALENAESRVRLRRLTDRLTFPLARRAVAAALLAPQPRWGPRDRFAERARRRRVGPGASTPTSLEWGTAGGCRRENATSPPRPQP